MANVGDEVLYVPDKCYAARRDMQGTYPWEGKGAARGGAASVLTDDQIDMQIKSNKQRRAPIAVAFTKPLHTWKGIVTAVRENGNLDMDVTGYQAGLTLHANDVPYGKLSESRGHTWYVEDAPK